MYLTNPFFRPDIPMKTGYISNQYEMGKSKRNIASCFNLLHRLIIIQSKEKIKQNLVSAFEGASF
jgi:hypothetical protein